MGIATFFIASEALNTTTIAINSNISPSAVPSDFLVNMPYGAGGYVVLHPTTLSREIPDFSSDYWWQRANLTSRN